MPTRQTAGRLTLIVVSILVVVQASAQDVPVAVLRAAEQGDAAAQFNLGRMYQSIDIAETAKWYRLAAEQGHAGAQSALGWMYTIGQGVPQDHAEAARWNRQAIRGYRLAAEQGNAEAQFNLGLQLAPDDVEAAPWYRRAADQGHAEAQYFLGLF